MHTITTRIWSRRLRLRVAATALAIVAALSLGVAGTPAPAQAAAPSCAMGGSVGLMTLAPAAGQRNPVMDVANSNTAAGTAVIAFDYHGGQNQRFRFCEDSGGLTRIMFNGMCVSTSSLISSGVLAITLLPCNTIGVTQWRKSPVNGSYTFESSAWRGTCLDAWGGGYSGLRPLVAYPCNGSRNQQWGLLRYP